MALSPLLLPLLFVVCQSRDDLRENLTDKKKKNYTKKCDWRDSLLINIVLPYKRLVLQWAYSSRETQEAEELQSAAKRCPLPFGAHVNQIGCSDSVSRRLELQGRLTIRGDNFGLLFLCGTTRESDN